MMYYSSHSSLRSNRSRTDWVIVLCYLLLVLFGWINIYSSIQGSEPASILDFGFRSGKQAVWILTALGLAALTLFAISAQFWEVSSSFLYLVVGVLLVAVIFLSSDIKGSHSWFSLGPVSFQPAELSKITTSLLLSAIMSRSGFKINRRQDFLKAAACLLLPMLIIVAEQETGSALVYLGFIFVLYREGLSGWILAFGALVIALFIITMTASAYTAIVVLLFVVSLVYRLSEDESRRWLITDMPFVMVLAFLPLVWRWVLEAHQWSFFLTVKPMHILMTACCTGAVIYAFRAFRINRPARLVSLLSMVAGVLFSLSVGFIFDKVLEPHQQNRIEVLLGIKDDPSGIGYNVTQSKIAIGAGGLFGKGYLNGTQTAYGFVPEQSTDFIFCTVGEEWGWIGCLLVILLYATIIWRLINDAEKCRNGFTRIYGYCVASIIFMHLTINVGMTIGLMPVIGIPLPLMSYGGSSLWSFTLLLFIFLALFREERKYF